MSLDLVNVTCKQGGTAVLENITLNVPAGSLTVLCGITGSGKSTLLRVMAGLEAPGAGEVRFPAVSGNTGRSGGGTAIVFQHPGTQLFASTVAADMEYCLEQRRIARKDRPALVRQALETVGLSYETYRDRSPFLLSGGEQRRVAIAGAIAAGPQILLLDEPTAGLDPDAAAGLLDLIRKLHREGTAIVVGTHDLDLFFPLADQAAVLADGRLAWLGNPGTLAECPGTLESAGLEEPEYIRIGRKLLDAGWIEQMPRNPGAFSDDPLLISRLPAPPCPDRTMASAAGRALASVTGSAIASFTGSALASVTGSALTSAAGSTLTSATGSALASAADSKLDSASNSAPQEDRLSSQAIAALSTIAAPEATGHAGGAPSGTVFSTEPAGPHGTTSRLPGSSHPKLQPSRREQRHMRRESRHARWRRVDPRVKWLGMLLGSLALLGMEHAASLAAAALLIGCLVASAGIAGQQIRWFFRPFMLMLLFLWLVSSLSWNSEAATGFVFTQDGMLQGGKGALRLLLLLSLGFLFTETTGGAPLRESLEWAIFPLRRLGIRTRNASLAVSLTLQFVPMTLQTVSQLQMALRSRGGGAGMRRWTPRQLSLLFVPLLILVIRMGDELACAIESRGYDPAKERTPWAVLHWRRADSVILAGTAAVSAVLLLLP